MAHFFYEGKGTTIPENFIKVAAENTVNLGIWGANVNGGFLMPSCNDSSIAVVLSKGTSSADGMIRNIVLKGVREGNVMLEARLGEGGPVWAYTQVAVGKQAAEASAVALAAVELAREEQKRGVFEDDNENTGGRIDEYENIFGLKGQPWCAMFVYFCFQTAAAKVGVPNPLPKIAGAQALLTWATRNNKLIDEPVAGDVLIVKPGTHVGLVVGPPTSAGKVPSIEGNTWAHGTEEDHVDGVYEKSRPTAKSFYLRV